MKNTAKKALKTKKGVVISSKMDKTVVVRIDQTMRHPKYEKVIMRSKKCYAHDENNQANEGDVVTIAEMRPMSKTKRWRLVSNELA